MIAKSTRKSSRTSKAVTPLNCRSSPRLHVQPGPSPLPKDYKPTAVDILCGRGRGSRNHSGNKLYKTVIKNNTKRYSDAPKKIQKSLVVASVVDSIRESGALFVKKDKTTERWYDIGDNQAREKTGHAIRDYIAKLTKTSKLQDILSTMNNDRDESNSGQTQRIRHPSPVASSAITSSGASSASAAAATTSTNSAAAECNTSDESRAGATRQMNRPNNGDNSSSANCAMNSIPLSPAALPELCEPAKPVSSQVNFVPKHAMLSTMPYEGRKHLQQKQKQHDGVFETSSGEGSAILDFDVTNCVSKPTTIANSSKFITDPLDLYFLPAPSLSSADSAIGTTDNIFDSLDLNWMLLMESTPSLRTLLSGNASSGRGSNRSSFNAAVGALATSPLRHATATDEVFDQMPIHEIDEGMTDGMF